ncbi:hypothetical protein [Carnobacterium gallinarum]|uniref:YobI family P-loop NTPase n=1 Tax=Carnobacterium gallinarum TaxID=2749 RepID=UPI00054D7B07|nr:hypothetical protein [Carnobacterium gallinarum]
MVDLKFEKLTPDKDVDISSYEEALNFSFSNEDVTNVALTGSYGVGKSSIIETYENKHPENNYLHILFHILLTSFFA